MKENKTQKKIFKILLIVFSLVICFTGGFFTHYLLMPNYARKLGDIITIINSVSKDPNGNDITLDTEEMAKGFVNAVLKNDDYAQYFTDEEYKEKNNEGDGRYSGIGIALYANAPKIYSVLGNSPAENAGIKSGDVILRAKLTSQTEFIEFTSIQVAIDFFTNVSDGDEIEIIIKRDGVFEERSFTLTERKYVCSYVYYYDNQTSLRFVSEDERKPIKKLFNDERLDALPSDTALILFKAFEGDSATQLGEALSYFYSSGKSKLIFDLRGNGGGYMDCLREVASYFINNNKNNKNLVTEVEERKGSSCYYTKGNNFDDRLKNIVVLADGGTASASECLIGAMLCYNDANFSKDNLLIAYNTKRGNYSTYGKGIMQTTYPLLSGGALKLTTARVLWPDRETCIHGTGIIQENTANHINSENAISRAVEILTNYN